MKTYIVKVDYYGCNIVEELNKLGEIEYVSELYNLYKITTNKSIEEIEAINGVKSVREEGWATLLNKDAPMEVNWHTTKYGRNNEAEAVFQHCPRCDQWFPLGHRQNYCDKCGQRLKFN